MVVSSRKEVALKQAILYALGKVGKPGIALKDEQTLAAHRLSSLLPEISIPGNLGALPAHFE